MARFNRINLDGNSVTETRTAATDVRPGTALVISGEQFAAPTASAAQKLYVANTGHLQGLTADDVIPAGDSIEGEYLETGRGLAVLVAAETEVSKDTPLTVNSNGYFVVAGAGGEDTPADRVVAFSQEDYETGEDAELVWVRGA